MESRPTGRSRGRARTVPPQSDPTRGQGARRPGPSQPEQPSGFAPHSVGRSVRAPVPPSGTTQGERQPGMERPTTSAVSAAPAPVVTVGGGGDAARGVAGRGAMRGRQVINPEVLMTRSAHTKASKKGIGGAPITLQTNFFKILNAPDWCLFQYRVDFAPEEDRNVVRKGLLRLHREKLGVYMFDGSVMYTCNRYPNINTNDSMKLYSERQSDGAKIEISIRFVGEMARGDPHYLQLFNIILRRGLEHLRLQLVGRNYFDARAKIEIKEHRFELWPGYQTSIRQHEYNVLMSVEVISKVMRNDTLLTIMHEVRQNHRGGDIQGACKAEVIGLTVLTDYNNNTYRIEDIDFTQNPKCEFLLKKENRNVTYIEYYQKKYNLHISNVSQPLLVTRPSLRERRAGKDETLFLIPELCRATGMTDAMRNNYKLMGALAVHTRIRPDIRIDRLLGFNRRLQQEPPVVEEFKQWNLQLDNKLVEVQGRVLPTEHITFGASRESAGKEVDWSRAFRNARLMVCTKLNDWVLIVPNRVRNDAEAFVKNIMAVGRGMTFMVSPPIIRELKADNPQAYAEELEGVMRRVNPQLICCVAMRPRADVYSAIKRKCCVDRPVPSQVILAKNLNGKGAMSIATKVAIQLNCKIGGAPWTIEFGHPGLMVVGFDVCHDPNHRGTDFGAMVASLDRGMTRYFSAVSAHKSNEELTNEFSGNMVKALRKYAETNNGQFPSHIVIYRDGVGDGQIPYVFEHEVKHIRESLEKFYPNVEALKLAFIIVTKRINIRLFYNRRDNPPPGTVVDDIITNPWRYDFFIVSQFVKQGSVSPTAYNVIYDNIGLDVSAVQQLTYRLTHMYFNWSGTIRVPAPCQYAHKLAFLVAQAIHTSPSSHLETLLYFL